MARFYSYVENGYLFKCYPGNWQKIKYDDRKEDYYVTYQGRRFYFNDCIRTGTEWQIMTDHFRNYLVVGTWQEGYSVYELQCEDAELTEGSRCRVVYCPPATGYIEK